MGGLYMKSADNHTKRKAPVEAFFYRELMSHGRITMPPQGSFLAGQKYTQPWHTDYDMHVRRQIMTKTQWRHLRTHTLQEKRCFNVFFPLLSQVHPSCLCLVEKRDLSHSILTLKHYPPVYPSVHLIFSQTCLCVSQQGIMLCSPFILAENISMWSWTHLSEPDGCLSNCHSPLPHLLRQG